MQQETDNNENIQILNAAEEEFFQGGIDYTLSNPVPFIPSFSPKRLKSTSKHKKKETRKRKNLSLKQQAFGGWMKKDTMTNFNKKKIGKDSDMISKPVLKKKETPKLEKMLSMKKNETPKNIVDMRGKSLKNKSKTVTNFKKASLDTSPKFQGFKNPIKFRSRADFAIEKTSKNSKKLKEISSLSTDQNIQKKRVRRSFYSSPKGKFYYSQAYEKMKEIKEKNKEKMKESIVRRDIHIHTNNNHTNSKKIRKLGLIEQRIEVTNSLTREEIKKRQSFLEKKLDEMEKWDEDLSIICTKKKHNMYKPLKFTSKIMKKYSQREIALKNTKKRLLNLMAVKRAKMKSNYTSINVKGNIVTIEAKNVIRDSIKESLGDLIKGRENFDFSEKKNAKKSRWRKPQGKKKKPPELFKAQKVKTLLPLFKASNYSKIDKEFKKYKKPLSVRKNTKINSDESRSMIARKTIGVWKVYKEDSMKEIERSDFIVTNSSLRKSPTADAYKGYKKQGKGSNHGYKSSRKPKIYLRDELTETSFQLSDLIKQKKKRLEFERRPSFVEMKIDVESEKLKIEKKKKKNFHKLRLNLGYFNTPKQVYSKLRGHKKSNSLPQKFIALPLNSGISTAKCLEGPKGVFLGGRDQLAIRGLKTRGEFYSRESSHNEKGFRGNVLGVKDFIRSKKIVKGDN